MPEQFPTDARREEIYRWVGQRLEIEIHEPTPEKPSRLPFNSGSRASNCGWVSSHASYLAITVARSPSRPSTKGLPCDLTHNLAAPGSIILPLRRLVRHMRPTDDMVRYRQVEA